MKGRSIRISLMKPRPSPSINPSSINPVLTSPPPFPVDSGLRTLDSGLFSGPPTNPQTAAPRHRDNAPSHRHAPACSRAPPSLREYVCESRYREHKHHARWSPPETERPDSTNSSTPATSPRPRPKRGSQTVHEPEFYPNPRLLHPHK